MFVLLNSRQDLKDLKLFGGAEQGLGTTGMMMVMSVLILILHDIVDYMK